MELGIVWPPTWLELARVGLNLIKLKFSPTSSQFFNVWPAQPTLTKLFCYWMVSCKLVRLGGIVWPARRCKFWLCNLARVGLSWECRLARAKTEPTVELPWVSRSEYRDSGLTVRASRIAIKRHMLCDVQLQACRWPQGRVFTTGQSINLTSYRRGTVFRDWISKHWRESLKWIHPQGKRPGIVKRSDYGLLYT